MDVDNVFREAKKYINNTEVPVRVFLEAACHKYVEFKNVRYINKTKSFLKR